MCVAVPVEIIEIQENEAVVNYGGVKKLVNISLLEDVKVGDYVLLHAGCALYKIDEEEAMKTLALFQEILECNEG